LSTLDEPDRRNESPEQIKPLLSTKKYLCGIKFKLWEVKPDPNDDRERMIEKNLTVESLRLATNAAFFTIIILGIAATRIFNKPETLMVGKSLNVFSIWPHPQKHELNH
jgi:hypothetical protein